jgi:hypothetical protein
MPKDDNKEKGRCGGEGARRGDGAFGAIFLLARTPIRERMAVGGRIVRTDADQRVR